MTILIAYDGSDDSKAAIAFAGELFRGQQAVVLTVWERLAMTSARASAGLMVALDQSGVEDEAIGQAMSELAGQGPSWPARRGWTRRRGATRTPWPSGRPSWTWRTRSTPSSS
ncbi:universal stress protein [Nonomuraea thailandensis]